MSKSSVANYVLLLLALVCGLFALLTYGIALPDSPFVPVAFEGPITLDSDGNVTAVIDSESRRLLLLDADDRLVSMISYDSFSSPIETVTDVCVSDDMVYVAGVKYQQDYGNIQCERVLAYSARGAYRRTVYESTPYMQFYPSITSLHAAPDGFIMGFARDLKSGDRGGQSLQFLRFATDQPSSLTEAALVEGVVYSGGYSTVANAYAVTNDLGILGGSFCGGESVVPDRVFSTVDMGDDGRAYGHEDIEGAICAVSSDGSVERLVSGRGITKVSCNGSILSYCSNAEGMVGISDNQGKTVRRLHEVKPTMQLSVILLMVIGSRIFLGIFASILLVQQLLSILRKGDIEALGTLFASLSVVAAVSMVIGYTSYKTYQELVNNRLDAVNAFADYLAFAAADLSEDAERCANRTIFREGAPTQVVASQDARESYQRLVDPAINLANAAIGNRISIYACVYAKDSAGVFYLFDSTREHIFGASLSSPIDSAIDDAFDAKTTVSSDLYSGSLRRDTTSFRLVPIKSKDGRSVPVVVEIGSHMRSLRSSVLNSQTERIASVLVMLAVVYLTYSELRACGGCLYSYREYLGEDDMDALVLLTRPFTFGITALASIDSVMTVLIARQLARPYGSAWMGVLVAIPSVMLGIGLALGHAFYGRMGARMSPRRLGVRGALTVMVGALIAIVSIISENLALYCLAKLVLAMPLGTLYSFGYSLPRRADSKEVRGEAQEGVTRTDTSAAALGTILGGYAASVLGTVWVYVVVACAAVLMMAFARYVFPKHMNPIERPHVRSLKQTLGFLCSKPVLPIIVFIMFPVVMAGGYDSFMFPLFSADLGVSTSAIHNIAVSGRLVVYVMIAPIGEVNKRFDKWAATFASVALIGVSFMVLSLNTTLAWATAAIAVIGVLSKCSDGWKTLWLRAAKRQSYPRGTTTGMMFAIRSLLLMIQPLCLTFLLSWGEQVALMVLGGLCLAGAIAFAISTKDSEIVPEGWELPDPPQVI